MEDCLIVHDDTPKSHQMTDSEICDIITNDIYNGSDDDNKQNEVGKKS